MGHPKRKLVFQPSIFRCYVSFREGKRSKNLSNTNSNWGSSTAGETSPAVLWYGICRDTQLWSWSWYYWLWCCVMICFNMFFGCQFSYKFAELGYRKHIKTKWMIEKKWKETHLISGCFWKCKLLPMKIWCSAFWPSYDTPRRYRWYISLSCQWNPRIIQDIWNFDVFFLYLERWTYEKQSI